MSEQLGLFDAAAGEAAKEEAVSRVEANASRAWLDAAWTCLIAIWADRRDWSIPEMTSDDVWDRLARRNVPAPHEPRAMSAVMRRGVAEGKIAATSEFRPSALPQNHRRPVRVYRVVR